MHRHHTSPIVAGAVAAALALPIGWALGPAGAEPRPETTTTAATASTPATSDGQRGARLAAELGITPEELHAARLNVLEDRLAERVAEGKLDQDAADDILEAARAGDRTEFRRLVRRARAARR